MDVRTFAFLTATALEDRKKTLAEEEAARVELRSLLAVPRSRRTAEQESRLDAVSRLLSAASRRKRKKKRKNRLPKSSARQPPSSGIRTGKSGHYSTSSSFWQSPVRCPGVARFNSGYSSCVSSQRLWISFLFSTCWTQILRSFLNLDILLLTPGIWQPLVRCLPCPRSTGELEFSGRLLATAPCIWQSFVLLRSTRFFGSPRDDFVCFRIHRISWFAVDICIASVTEAV